MTAPAPTAHRPEVEGLRAVAVLLVVGDHLFGFPLGGFVGVDVFFVLSGFLITGLLVRELDASGRLDLRAFWGRRVRRLMPAALTVLAVTAVAAQLLFLPLRAAQTARDTVWAALFSANVQQALLGTDYFSATRPPSPVQHFWSLAVEEQFYLLWPLLVLLAWRRGGRALLRRVVLAVVLLGLTWSVVETALSPTTAYFSTGARSFELAAGALLALRAPRAIAVRGAALLGTVGAVLVLGSALLLRPDSPFPGAVALLPVAGTVALIAAGTAGPGRLLATAAPRYVGRLSYVLYLWHWPVLVLATAAVPTASPVLLLALAVGLSVLTHHLLEQPLRRPRPQRRPLVLGGVLTGAAAAVAVTAVVAVGVLPAAPAPQVTAAAAVPPGGSGALAPPGAYPDRATAGRAVSAALRTTDFGTTEPALDALDGAGAPEWVEQDCLDVFPSQEQRCAYGPATAPRTAVLLGDSVGISLLPGLRAALPAPQWRVQVLTRRQCALQAPDDAVSPGCVAHREHVLDRVDALAPELVVVSGSYVAGSRAFSSADAAAWEQGAGAALERLRAPGRRVVLVGATPRTGNLQACATRLAGPEACVRELDPTWRALAAADRRAAAATGAGWVDPSAWLCDDGRCPAVVDGTPVAFDGTHLTAAQSRRLALLLRADLLPAAAGATPGT